MCGAQTVAAASRSRNVSRTSLRNILPSSTVIPGFQEDTGCIAVRSLKSKIRLVILYVRQSRVAPNTQDLGDGPTDVGV
ncbi:hypothetical protein ElyMa_006697600 [Elysia marginata]|uniref:Uncharacterized protein n=1 Tax=Elysia marginata TaxID=1093978 RepID=A0AAV4IPB5_9GAST|nr:hypothetical protein ElyMa_006697600 [Elysia marginata]